MKRRDTWLRCTALAALVCALASCVVMKPITPDPDLQRVAIGDGKGSARAEVPPAIDPYVTLESNNVALFVRPVIRRMAGLRRVG